jgi:hypothetical protein
MDVIMEKLGASRQMLSAILEKTDVCSEDFFSAETATLLETIPTDECSNYFRSAGYKSA